MSKVLPQQQQQWPECLLNWQVNFAMHQHNDKSLNKYENV